MPIQHAIWKVGEKPVPLGTSRLPSEQKLEEMIANDLTILSSEWMLIGRQENTQYGGRVDLLAIAPDGSLVLIEIKRDKTPREIVAQALDYASWVERLTSDKIAEIYQRFSKGGNLDEAFQKRFNTELDEETLNQSHQIVLVASQLDEASERIINYLNERDIAINVMSFQVFQNGNDQLLSRTWMIDPGETQANVVKTEKGKGEKEPWNGEFYISFGGRDWEDARKYGYIGGGGGTWYSHSLNLLSPGDRVWVKIPHVGYVGVGRVVEASRPAKEFMLQTPEGERSALDIIKDGVGFKEFADDPEKSEYMVRIDWLDTVPEAKAVNEVGMFGNQNTVCQPNTPKWRSTVERLKPHFPKWDTQSAQ